MGFEIDNEVENVVQIKVIGVGGGGGNAVNRMVSTGIRGVEFIAVNTDKQMLLSSQATHKIQIGEKVTRGMGAGGKPEVGQKAAEESRDVISDTLKGTDMVFITAGMGGGTGTGAAPVIAREAKAMGILTVGIVTIPFLFEGTRKIDQALDGVEEIAKHVDALLVINNERLREIYPDLNVLSAFQKADNTLSIAARSIAEIITMHGVINLDFRDVSKVLKDGGVAIMSYGIAEGDRIQGRAGTLLSWKSPYDLNAAEKAQLIIDADEIAAGNYHDQFIVDPIQGGAGTSMNMNINKTRGKI